MACSFRHSDRTSFQPSTSSTKILRDNDTGEIAIELDETCDLCQGEEIPLCVKYCVYGARGLA